MKYITIALTCCMLSQGTIQARIPVACDTLPTVLADQRSDLLEKRITYAAASRFAELQLPDNIKDWEAQRANIRKLIIQKTGTIIDRQLPLDITETGRIKMPGYTIRNIFFQTRPGIYATANLFIPDGKGPFPAVINVHAHSGRFDDKDQAVAHLLALDGFVCLSIDPWGAGERTTIHGTVEYHGANLGASVMNIGETLMGIQISDNMRGVDLLCSLPEVDSSNIGAAGASGGGNQTMWLAAVDERIKAALPVVSVGTFESYVMRDNCICEILVDGLNFTEESGVLALVAPRAIKICNHNKDEGPAFYPSEMIRSFTNARPIFKMMGVEDKIAYQLFDIEHGFLKEDREAMLGWFDLHLKGTGDGKPKNEPAFTLLTEEQLMVFPKGKRDPKILGTRQYCETRGKTLRSSLLQKTSFDVARKKKELRDILRVNEPPPIVNSMVYPAIQGWERVALETSGHKIIPVLHMAPAHAALGYQILCHPRGKNFIPESLIDSIRSKGFGIALVDLSGAGEASSPRADRYDESLPYHTQSRAELWLGRSMLGEWGNELKAVISYLRSARKAADIRIDGSGEAGLAALFMAAGSRQANIREIVLRDAPLSYLFDPSGAVDFFSMAIHLPGLLNWGDVSLAAALTGIPIRFIHPVTMGGKEIADERLRQYAAEFDQIRKRSKQPGASLFK